MRKQFGDHMDILCRKGFYPYEWVDSIDKLIYIGIPPAEVFHSQLKHESVLYAVDNEDDNKKENISS